MQKSWPRTRNYLYLIALFSCFALTGFCDERQGDLRAKPDRSAVRLQSTEIAWPEVATDQSTPVAVAENHCYDTACPGYTQCTLTFPKECNAYWSPSVSCNWHHVLGACLCATC